MNTLGNQSTALYRSVLICPGNRPRMIEKLGTAGADAVIADLEDGTPDVAKVAARNSAVAGIRSLIDAGCSSQAFIRTNAPSSQYFEGDLEAIVAGHVPGIVVPKVGSVDQVIDLERRLTVLERKYLRPPVSVILGIETVAGVNDAVDIARASPRAVALYFGAEDYITDLGGRRTRAAPEVLHARSLVAIAARLRGVAALDYATLEVHDEDRLREEATTGKDLGFTGRICLHPNQVPLAHSVYAPSAEELDRSRRLLDAYQEALDAGQAVCAFEGQMIDGPLVTRAENLIAAAERHRM